jgi:hypothetical protein
MRDQRILPRYRLGALAGPAGREVLESHLWRSGKTEAEEG